MQTQHNARLSFNFSPALFPRLSILGAAIFAYLGACLSASTAWPLASPASIEIDRIEENGTLYFKTSGRDEAPKPIQSQLYDLKLVGTLQPNEGGLPYFVLTGRPCQSCLQDKAIYVLRPKAGKPVSFVYPGKIIDPKTGSVILDSRAFIGNCLPGRGDSLVIYSKERFERKGRMRTFNTVFIAEAGPDHLEEKLIERGGPDMSLALRATRMKSCNEIEGRNRRMVSRPSMLLPSKRADESAEADDVDDDDDVKISPTPPGGQTQGSGTYRKSEKKN